MSSENLISHFLPEGILKYFDIKSLKANKDRLTFVLEEKPLTQKELSHRKLHSKGFYPAVEIQDFPIRGKAGYLEVKRRRWLDLDTNELYSRDWDLLAKGTRMTAEFAFFLKKLIR